MEINPSLLHEGKKVLIGLPWYKTASPLTSFCMMALMDRRKYGISLGFGDAFIAHSRNKLATQLLNSDFEWLLMVDDDMIIPWGDAKWFNDHTGLNLADKFAGLHTIDRLLSHRKTLVGALYFGRWHQAPPVFAEGRQMDKMLRTRGPVDEIRPTKWVGTGCSLFHRSVFLDIEKMFPNLSRERNSGNGQYFTSSEHDLCKAADQSQIIANDDSLTPEVRIAKIQELLRKAQAKSSVHSSAGMGEDVQCCVRATQAGHQPHVDIGLLCGHVGSAVYPIR